MYVEIYVQSISQVRARLADVNAVGSGANAVARALQHCLAANEELRVEVFQHHKFFE
jgi:hypothetical protein